MFCLFAQKQFHTDQNKVAYLVYLARKRIAMDTISLRICLYVNEITKSCIKSLIDIRNDI